VKISLSTSVLASIAIVSGVIVLLGYFIDLPWLHDLRLLLVDWAVILAAIALLVGVLNLIRVHWKRFRASQKGSTNSLVLIISIFTTLFVVGIWGRPTTAGSMWIYNYILVPIEASLLALLAVVLIHQFARMFNRNITIPVLVFAGVVLFVLLGAFTFPGLNIPLLVELRSWITQVWALAGMRGILLGVALGTIATGLRILLGSDRPYGG
jgi:hypothetical protein